MALLEFFCGVLVGVVMSCFLQSADNVSFLTNVITGLVTLLRDLVQAIASAIVQSRIVERLCHAMIDYSDKMSDLSVQVVDWLFPRTPNPDLDANYTADGAARALVPPARLRRPAARTMGERVMSDDDQPVA